MTVVLCARLSKAFNLADLSQSVKSSFSNTKSKIYIEEIENRQSRESVRESLSALSLLSSGLSLFQKDFQNELILAKTEKGKPYFENSDLKFSVSHSKGYVACAISDESELGIDIEASEISNDRAVKTAKRFFSENDSLKIIDFPEKFAKMWSEKEAIAKFYGIELVKFLENDKTTNKISQQDNYDRKIKLHYFEYKNKPITLCTNDKTSVEEIIEIDL